MKNKTRIIFSILVILGIFFGYMLGGVVIENINEGEGIITGLHYSYFSDKSFSDKAYKNISEKSTLVNNVKGVVVNHHLLAANLIAETINSVATTSQITVVLVSPNHFFSGQGQIISSLYDWHTPYGELAHDQETILKLKDLGVINIDEYPFDNEHGISGIAPFIKKSLPNSKLVPIIVKDNLSQNDLNKFVDSLYFVLGENLLIIGSFDFSHFYPDSQTQVYDKQSLAVINNFDFTGLKNIQIDSKPGLEIVMKYMQKVKATQFNLIANTNSAQILRDNTIKEAVSYIDGSFSSDVIKFNNE